MVKREQLKKQKKANSDGKQKTEIPKYKADLRQSPQQKRQHNTHTRHNEPPSSST
jgi:hypothetical protein